MRRDFDLRNERILETRYWVSYSALAKGTADLARLEREQRILDHMRAFMLIAATSKIDLDYLPNTVMHNRTCIDMDAEAYSLITRYFIIPTRRERIVRALRNAYRSTRLRLRGAARGVLRRRSQVEVRVSVPSVRDGAS